MSRFGLPSLFAVVVLVNLVAASVAWWEGDLSTATFHLVLAVLANQLDAAGE